MWGGGGECECVCVVCVVCGGLCCFEEIFQPYIGFIIIFCSMINKWIEYFPAIMRTNL